MEELLPKITPILETLRSWIMWVADKGASAFTLEIDKVYLFLLVGISLWVGKKIFDFFYSNTEGRWGYWAVIAGGIFFILKYLGVSA